MSREWVSLAAAGRKIGASAHTVKRLAERGQLTIRTLPGCRARVPAAEVDQLAAEHTQKAARLHTASPGQDTAVRLQEPVLT
ncbi:MAG: hypothetical protein ACLP9L_22215 [Thermoguttaceae bacterium]